MYRQWVVVFALWSTSAAGQSVHKCVTAGGAVSYQNEPCGRNSRDAANWEAPRDPPRSSGQRPDPASKPGRERSPEPRPARARPVRTGTARIAHTAPEPSYCEIAKAQRDGTLERVGLKRTFDLLSRLDEQVRKACR